MEKSLELQNTSIMITGASSGIGEAIAIAAGNQGANVAITGRSKSRLESLKMELEKNSGKVVVIAEDLSQKARVQSMVEEVISEFGGLDVLVNNAGIGFWKSISAADIDDWEKELQVNLLAPMITSRLIVDEMIEKKSGHIVFISSLSGRYPGPEYPSYAASKAGLNSFADSIRIDLRSKGVKVTLIEPGAVDTPMQAEEERGQDRFLYPADVADAVIYALTRPGHVCISNIALVRSVRES